MAALKVERVHKSFGDLAVLRDISMAVTDGEFCILLGPSGCGKTTLLRIVAGLEPQDAGQVWIGDREVSQLSPKERNVAMVFQSYALYPHMSVFENLAFPLRARKVPQAEVRGRVREAASLLGIESLLDRKPKQLSGGQRQRVAIGRAIVRNPALFLFDEPLSNLDAKLRSGMRVELAKLQRGLGATILYVTHDQVEAMTLAQKIVLLHEGSIQQVGSPHDLYHSPSNLFVARFIGSPPMNVIAGTVQIQQRRTVFVSPGLAVDLGEDARHRELAGAEVSLGIRPESVKLGHGPHRGEIEVLENLGAEALVYLNTEGSQLVARTHSSFRGAPGEPVSFGFEAGGVHLFKDEVRLTRREQCPDQRHTRRR